MIDVEKEVRQLNINERNIRLALDYHRQRGDIGFGELNTLAPTQQNLSILYEYCKNSGLFDEIVRKPISEEICSEIINKLSENNQSFGYTIDVPTELIQNAKDQGIRPIALAKDKYELKPEELMIYRFIEFSGCIESPIQEGSVQKVFFPSMECINQLNQTIHGNQAVTLLPCQKPDLQGAFEMAKHGLRPLFDFSADLDITAEVHKEVNGPLLAIGHDYNHACSSSPVPLETQSFLLSAANIYYNANSDIFADKDYILSLKLANGEIVNLQVKDPLSKNELLFSAYEREIEALIDFVLAQEKTPTDFLITYPYNTILFSSFSFAKEDHPKLVYSSLNEGLIIIFEPSNEFSFIQARFIQALLSEKWRDAFALKDIKFFFGNENYLGDIVGEQIEKVICMCSEQGSLDASECIERDSIPIPKTEPEHAALVQLQAH